MAIFLKPWVDLRCYSLNYFNRNYSPVIAYHLRRDVGDSKYLIRHKPLSVAKPHALSPRRGLANVNIRRGRTHTWHSVNRAAQRIRGWVFSPNVTRCGQWSKFATCVTKQAKKGKEKKYLPGNTKILYKEVLKK